MHTHTYRAQLEWYSCFLIFFFAVLNPHPNPRSFCGFPTLTHTRTFANEKWSFGLFGWCGFHGAVPCEVYVLT
uniref:Putative secreted protein n=1 Tax=Anopheles marajoara TaxID=58244 RepID=A0A2M4CDN4_9DIPT